ncbi:MAG: hypothetical protein Q8M08_13845, partial [Bacteroidales bacterium]|nr:hypothetical protein [Bacteroidales bacterium]
MKKNFLPITMMLLLLIFGFYSLNTNAQQPGSKSPTVSASLTLQPDITGLCIGATVYVPIHISGDNVLAMDLYLDFNHSVLTPAPGPGYANVYPGFTAIYNYSYSGAYPNTVYLGIFGAGFTGTNFNGEKIIDLAFIYQGGSTTIHFRRTPDATPPPVCAMWDEFGGTIAPVTYTDNQVSGFPNLMVGSISANQTICSGAVPAMLLGVAPANGTTPTYQWQSSTDNVTFNNISGATMVNYQPVALTATTYYRQLQNATGTCGGPLPTNTATITVNPLLPVSVTIAADANPVCDGTSVSFTATPVNGGTTPAYQWKVNGANAGTSLSTYAYVPANGDMITCELTSNETCVSGNPATSNTVTMVIDPLMPVSVSIAADANPVCSGTSVTFTATPVNGGTTPSYQWMVNAGVVIGATNATYSYMPANNDVITCTLSSSETCVTGNPATSGPVTMTIDPPLAVGSISANQTICSGTVPVQLDGVAPSNGTSPTFQWQDSPDNITFNDIFGATMLNYQPGALTSTTYYRQMQNATGACGGPLPTNTATITVNPLLPVSVTIAADANPVCDGTSVSFSAAPVNGGTTPAYQWKVNGANAGTGLSTYAYVPANGDMITCELTSNEICVSGNPATSNTVTMVVDPILPVSVSIAADANPVCSGTSVTFTATPVNGGTMPAYQWMVNAGTIIGATNATYAYIPVNNDVVTCMLSSSETCVTGNPAISNPVTMTVDVSLAVGSISADQTICSGAVPAQLDGVAPSNGTSPTYQWQSSLDNSTFVNIAGATMLNYQPGALTTTTYYREMQNATGTCGGPLPTNTITITVNPLLPVSVTIAAGANPVCDGTSVTFTATPVNGGTLPAYQWKVNGTNAGTDLSTYSYVPANGDMITCELTSNETCVTGNPAMSNTVTMVVDPLMPVSVSIAADANPVCSGTSVTFTATPVNGGVTPAYQWMVNAGTISGATNATYAYIPVNNDVVTCMLTSSENCVTGNPATSNPVTMTVDVSLAVGSISADQTICSGTIPAMLLGVAPSNGTSPTYQWQSSLDNSTFVNIAGATLLNYQPGALTTTTYYREMQDATGTCGGPLPTNTVTITVNPLLPVSVTIAAGANPVCDGTSVTFTATPVNGGPTPAYQWMLNGLPAGSNNPTYTYVPANGDMITCDLTSNETCVTGNPATSNTVTMVVNPLLPVSVTIAASTNPVCSGTSVTFTATPVNGGTLPIYQWSVNTFIIPGATSDTYTYIPVNNDVVTSVLSSSEICVSGNPATSNAVTMMVEPQLAVGSISANQTICSGTIPAMLLGVAPSNGTSPTYQWQSSLDNSTFVNIAGATMLNYQPGVLTATTYYKQMQDATGTCGGPLPTNTVTISVNQPLAVGSISASQSICSGTAPAQLMGIAPTGGDGIYTYQWQESADNVTFNNIAGATDLNYQPGILMATTYYHQIQSGTCGGPFTTNAVTITVTPALMVGSISADQTICSGTVPALLLGVAPSNGTSPTYQWQSSLDNSTFVNIAGATMLNYQPGALTTTTYYREMQDATGTCGGPLPTNTVTIMVNPSFVAGMIGANQSICSGMTPAQLTGTAPTGGDGIYTYQWQESIDNVIFADISGATTLNYQPGALTVTTYYQLVQSGTCGGPLATNTVTITIDPPLSVGSISADQTICSGTIPAQLNGIAPSNGTSPTYQWQSSLDNVTFVNISGATALNYQPGALTATTYYLQIQNASGTCGGPLPTNVVTITVTPTLIVGSISVDQTICSGTVPAQLDGVAPSNGTSPTYQWQSSLDNSTFVNISGATMLNYQPGALTSTTYFKQMQDATGTCGGPLPTNTVTITVTPNLVVGSISADQTICANTAPAMLIGVAPTGGTSPAYQWQSSLDNVTFANISGATALNYQPGILTTTTYFQLVQNASGTCGGPLTTNVVTITTSTDAVLIPGTIASNQTICANTAPAMLTGTPPLNGTAPTYQWQSSLNNVTFANISGATALNYQPGVLTAVTYYRLLQNASGTCGGPLPTNVVVINLTPNLVVGSIGANQLICAGNTPALLTGVPPANGTAPTYQWQSSLDNVTFTNILGATALNYQPGTIIATTYYRQLQNATGTCGGPLPTNVVTITFNANLAVGSISASQSICTGSTPSLLTGVAPSNGTAPTYQWQSSLNNVTFSNISGATMLNYQPGALAVTTYYRLQQNASGTCGGPLPTNVVTITVNPLPVPTITGPASVCVNSTGNVYTTQTGMTGYTWTVSAGGTITAGTGTSAITVTWSTIGAKTVTVNYTNANNCTATTPTTYNVTVNALPVPTITGPASVCVNSTGNVYTTQTGMTGYTWTVSAGGIITAGAGTNAITVTWNTVGANTVTVNYSNANNCTAATPTTYNMT